jgi:hypothetical protein
VERRSSIQHFLLAWIVLGLIVLASFPIARGNAMFGATLPFWLIVAPALDLAWLTRHHAIADLRRWTKSLRGVRTRRSRRKTMALRGSGRGLPEACTRMTGNGFG